MRDLPDQCFRLIPLSGNPCFHALIFLRNPANLITDLCRKCIFIPDFSRLDTFPIQNPLQHPGNLFHLLLCFSFSKHVILQTYSRAQTHFSHTQDVQDPARSSFSGGSASHAAYFLPQNSRHHPRPVREACVLLLLFSDFA